MIQGLLQRLFRLNHEYDTLIIQQRAQRLLYIIGSLIVALVLWLIIIIIPSIANNTLIVQSIVLPVVVLPTCFILYGLVQRGYILRASQIFVAILFLFSIPLSANALLETKIISIILPITMAGVLLSRRTLILITTSIILLILRAFLFTNDVSISIQDVIGLILIISLVATFLMLFNSSLESITESADDLIVKTRNLGQRQTTSSQETGDIITGAINHLRSQLGYSYIRVILLNEDLQAQQTYYSSIGLERVAEATAFTVTNNSAFQKAIDTGEMQFISKDNLGNLSAHLLPSSNTGVIIPAQSFNQTIALFDIQTESDDAINPEVATILNLYITQIAGSLIYQQMKNDLTSDINEQQTIITQQRSQIQSMQLLQTEGIVTDWQSYLQQRGLSTIGYNIDKRRQVSDLQMGDIPEVFRPVFEDGEIVIEQTDDSQQIIIPIGFRDTILGVLSFQIPKEIPITERKLDFIRSVTERLALALDNKRLLEQTQIQAQRESTANQIGSVLLSSTDVQSVLQTAVNQFNEALGAVSTQIYLQPTSSQAIDQKKQEGTV